MRRIVLPLLALLLLALASAPAWALEVFVLDNGSVIRGTVVREGDGKVVVRLAGFSEENLLTLREHEVVHRFATTETQRRPRGPTDVLPPPVEVPLGGQPGVPYTVRLDGQGRGRIEAGDAPDRGWNGPVLERRPAAAAVSPSPLDAPPVVDPGIEAEGFFARLERVTRMGLPVSLEGRMLVGVLLLAVLTVLVAGGTRVLGMKAPSLQSSTTLGILLGVFLMADILWHADLLRADRALWLLPVQAVAWLAVARGTLDAPLSRTVPLFALVLFASTCFVFATGSLLVSV